MNPLHLLWRLWCQGNRLKLAMSEEDDFDDGMLTLERQVPPPNRPVLRVYNFGRTCKTVGLKHQG